MMEKRAAWQKIAKTKSMSKKLSGSSQCTVDERFTPSVNQFTSSGMEKKLSKIVHVCLSACFGMQIYEVILELGQ